MVKSRSGLKITDFYTTKNGMVEHTCEKMHRILHVNALPSNLRMDNAGENYLRAQRLQSAAWKLPVTIEYTARNTPQQTSAAEVAIATLSNRARAMVVDMHVPEDNKHILYPEAIQKLFWMD